MVTKYSFPELILYLSWVKDETIEEKETKELLFHVIVRGNSKRGLMRRRRRSRR